MKNRFKFRYVLDKEVCEVLAFDVSDGIEHKCLFLQLKDGTRKIINDYDLSKFMQCTGLKDKNKRLIFEGDIVYDGKNKRIVLWEDDCFKYPALKTDRYFHKPISNFLDKRKTELRNKLTFTCNVFKKDKKNFEIIGNIYENEDLLKCENQ